MLALLPAALITQAAQGTDEESRIYKSKDRFGTPVFSDQASDGAEEVTLEEPMSYDGVKANEEFSKANRNRPEISADSAGKLPPYQSLSIVAPKNGEVIRDNAGNLSIATSVSPPVKPGHLLEVLMDGKPLASSGGSVSLTNVDRGTHQLQLRIIQVNNRSTFQEGSPISFTLQRHSVINRPNPGN